MFDRTTFLKIDLHLPDLSCKPQFQFLPHR